PIGNRLPEAGTQAIVGAVSQSSTAVVVKLAAAPEGPVHSFETFAPHVMVGGLTSTTVIVNEHVPVLFEASRAVQFTVCGPSENVLPETGVQLIVGAASHVSDAVEV